MLTTEANKAGRLSSSPAGKPFHKMSTFWSGLALIVTGIGKGWAEQNMPGATEDLIGGLNYLALAVMGWGIRRRLG